jgi:hypothetical protein
VHHLKNERSSCSHLHFSDIEPKPQKSFQKRALTVRLATNGHDFRDREPFAKRNRCSLEAVVCLEAGFGGIGGGGGARGGRDVVHHRRRSAAEYSGGSGSWLGFGAWGFHRGGRHFLRKSGVGDEGGSDLKFEMEKW